MKKSLHPVSDHAVIRYLERVKLLDMEEVRREIGRRVDLALEHPDATALVVDGVRFRLAGGVVTAVEPTGPRQRQVRRSLLDLLADEADEA